MFFEKSSGDPLVNFFSYIQDKSGNSSFSLLLSLVDRFLEETNEGFQGVLIHVTHDTESNN
jgi:hypothetical protein